MECCFFPNEIILRILTSTEYEPEELARKNLVSRQFREVISSLQTPQYWQREIRNRFDKRYLPNPYINWTKLYGKHATDANDRAAAYAEYTQSLPELPPHIPRWAKLVMKNGGTYEEKNEMRQIVSKYTTHTDPECQYYIALHSDKYRNDDKADLETLRLLKSAAAQGFAKAMDSLCDIYYYTGIGDKGLYGRIDIKTYQRNRGRKALKYARLAAERGIANAQRRVGFFQKAAGIALDHEENFRNLHLAAAQGDIRAFILLGECYLQGNGTVPNLDLAFKYYRMAAEEGDEYAAKQAELLEKNWISSLRRLSII